MHLYLSWISPRSPPCRLRNFAFPPAMYGNICFPTALPTEYVVKLVGFSPSDMQEMATHNGINLHLFLKLWAAFYMVKDHVIFFVNHLFIFLNHFSKALIDVLYTSGVVLLCDTSSNYYYVRNINDFSFPIQLFSYPNISH